MADDELTRWYHELRKILDTTADAMRSLGIARSSVALSDVIEDAAAESAEKQLARIDRLVRDANARADRLCAADPSLAPVVHPLLNEPGAPPSVDLRPWWSRAIRKISATARRHDAAEQLETLRLEADAALIRATARLARG